ncbi:MAG: hypothetical protein ACOCV1_03965 [Bacillota bacterium]
MGNSFFNSYHCTSKWHCEACRNIDDSTFREQLIKNFDDVSEINFECPHRVPWGAEKENLKKEKKRKFNDRNVVNIDLIKSNRELFEKIKGLKEIEKDYDKKVRESKCSPCLRARINRGIGKAIVAHIKEFKDLDFLDVMNENLILKDGCFNKKISEWKRVIKDAL